MLMRFDPFREVDRTAEQLTQRLTSPGVPFDAVRRGNKVIVNFDLPGVAEDSIDLTVERNVLTLNAERAIDWQDDDEVIANERRQGTLSRQLFLGDTLDTSKVEASYDRGVLTVTIPVAETAQPRKVAIAGTEGQPGAQLVGHGDLGDDLRRLNPDDHLGWYGVAPPVALRQLVAHVTAGDPLADGRITCGPSTTSSTSPP